MAKKLKTFTIELNEREAFLVWSIVAWFRPPATSALMQKLGAKGVADMRKKYERQFEYVIENQIISTGKWLEGYRKDNPRKLAPDGGR